MNRSFLPSHRVIRPGLLLAGLLVWLPLAVGQAENPAPAPHAPVDQPPPDQPGKPYIITLDGMVNEVMHDRLIRQTDMAQSEGASVIVLEMDTWGGMVGPALEMCDVIKNIQTPIIAWVHPKAISAGAMISVACDRIIVAERARLGDCAPIAGSGQAMAPTEREKIETVIREEFRDSARRNGYALTLSTAMVTLGPAVYQIRHRQTGQVRYVFRDQLRGYGLDEPDDAQLPAAVQPKEDDEQFDQPDQPGQNVIEQLQKALQPEDQPDDQADDADDDAEPAAPAQAPEQMPFDPGQWTLERRVLAENQLLTMSQDEAIDLGFARQIVRDDGELAAYLGVQAADMVRLEANWSEKMVSWLTSPFVRGILTIVLLMALYSEMSAPGLGFAGIVAIVAGVILLGAPYLAGLAEAWEIILVGVGIALLAVEIFVIPGFGVAGIAGLACMFIGLLLTFVEAEPGDGWVPALPGTWDALGEGMITILVASVLAMIGISFLSRYFGTIPLLNRIILTDAQASAASGGGAGTSAGAGGWGQSVNLEPGDTGVALGDLRPIGRAEINGQTHDVITAGGWIEDGSAIRVARIAGSRVEVEEA